MSNLDQAISEWRRQMLAAGIKNPVPLEELEIHLREEIERHTEAGLNESQAFQAAVEKIGQARLLQKEFKKVGKNHKIMRAILLVIGWLAAGYALTGASAGLHLGWDFMGFHPKWDQGIVDVLVILVAVVGIWFLAKARCGNATCVVSLLVCVWLARLAFEWYPPEKPFVILWASTKPSPFWFRGGLTVLLCAPSIFWVGWTWRHLTQKRSPMHGDLPIHSD